MIIQFFVLVSMRVGEFLGQYGTLDPKQKGKSHRIYFPINMIYIELKISNKMRSKISNKIF